MKKIFLLFCLIYSVMLFSQNTIFVNIHDCRKSNLVDKSNFENFSLYKDDSLYGNYNNRFIRNLPYGRYHIEYNTYFGRRKSEYQKIDEKSFYPYFEICVGDLSDDQKVNAKNLYVDSLVDGNQFVIGRHNAGCYVNNLDSLIITKDRGKYYIVRNRKKRKLNEDKLAVIRDFEIKMRNIKQSDFYSTEMCYTWIKFKDDEISFLNPNGDWEGYEYLLIQLGLVKKRKSFPFRERY